MSITLPLAKQDTAAGPSEGWCDAFSWGIAGQCQPPPTQEQEQQEEHNSNSTWGRPARILHCVAWAQVVCCTVFIYLLLYDARYQLQQQQLLHAEQQQQQQQSHGTPCSDDTSGQPVAKQPKLGDHCLPVVIKSLLQRHTALQQHQHSDSIAAAPDAGPAAAAQLGPSYSIAPDQAGLLPGCTIVAAKASLMALDILGLLLAVVLVHITWPAGSSAAGQLLHQDSLGSMAQAPAGGSGTLTGTYSSGSQPRRSTAVGTSSSIFLVSPEFRRARLQWLPLTIVDAILVVNLVLALVLTWAILSQQ